MTERNRRRELFGVVRCGAPALSSVILLVALLGCRGSGRGDLPASPSDPAPVRAMASEARGPLEALRRNPRYFCVSGSDAAVYLTGSHTWNNFQDWGVSDPPPAFDYPGYLSFLTERGHNFIRLYVWEQAAWFPGTEDKVVIAPLPYLRTGPGRALDGGPRFDLTQFDPAYFRRLRERVVTAAAGEIYVSVMLFNGWSVELKKQRTGNPWRGHPFNASNNVNGVDGDLNGDGEGTEVHTLRNPAVTALQRTYVRKVVETLGGLDNVLWEISNESGPHAVEWEREMIRAVGEMESAHGKRHPVGMTALWPPSTEGNGPLMDSEADWISPFDAPPARYRSDPPAGTGQKIVIVDTDHIWGVGGNPRWVWRCFMRGLNPIFMDPYVTTIVRNLPAWPEAASDAGTGRAPDGAASSPEWEAVRRAMGYTRLVAARVDLGSMEPAGEMSSTGYCLAEPGREYLVYLPSRARSVRRMLAGVLRSAAAERFTLDLSAAPGTFDAEWIDTEDGRPLRGDPVHGGRRVTLHAPFAGDAVLHLKLRPPDGPNLAEAGIERRPDSMPAAAVDMVLRGD